MLEQILEPFSYEYYIKALVVSTLVCSLAALISGYLVLKSFSLLGDALAHSLVPGVILSYIFNLPYIVGALLTCIIAVSLINFLNNKTALKSDAILGVVLSSFLALGLLIYSIHPIPLDVKNIILGNVLSISDTDLWQITVLSLITLIFIVCKGRDLLLVLFDYKFALAIGQQVQLIRMLFFLCVSFIIVASLQAVGVALTAAIIIIPGATSYLISNQMRKLVIISIVIGSSTGMLGAYFSYFINVPPSSLIVILQASIFSIVLFANKYYQNKVILSS